jgi:predicted RNase H-like HicB family nuclease
MEILGFSVVVVKEGKSYSAWCPDVDVASQGDTVEEAIANLREAIELHLENLSPAEIREMRQKHGSQLMTTLEVQIAY